MRVEHYDSETRQVSVLLEDALPDTPAKLYTYWNERFKMLKEMYAGMPATKQRQQVALERDKAQMESNRWSNLMGHNVRMGK